MSLYARGDHFRFGSVFIKKNNQTEIFFLKKKTETESNRSVSVRFFRAKTGLARFFQFWLDFLGFGSVFSGFGSVWLGFFVGFGSVRFFRFFAYKTKTEPNRPVFFRSSVFSIIFSNFLGFLVFFSPL